ncbi:hypothetical protein ECH7EC4401_0135 [Escherichia coli O157:H7 str. EC4401]|nr:hypothetical protein ECH7EC4401_0135 [Escherichia coli O157:H7 str. EC4401]
MWALSLKGHTANHQPGSMPGFLFLSPKKTHNQLYLLENK